MKKYPLIIFTVLFILGIIVEKYSVLDPVFIFSFLAAALASVLGLYFIKPGIRNYFLITIIIYGSVIFLGQLNFNAGISSGAGLPSKLFYTKIDVWGKISEINLIKNDKFDFTVEADSIKSTDKFIKSKIKLLVRFFGENNSSTYKIYDRLSIGDGVKISGKLTKSKKAGNPGEFDYSAVLEDRGIKGILSVGKPESIVKLSEKFSFPGIIFKIRKLIDSNIRQLHSQQSAALLRGLLLADRSIIDIELKDYFVNAGVVHLLAVSGLHVGYIILIILAVTGRLNLYLRSVFTIAGLVLFTLITGMPSSVVRASIMSIILIIAFISGRSTNLFNSLALAALLILIFKPSALFEPGFQLSFSAVLSIGIFYPKLKRISSTLSRNSRMLEKFLLFLSVSLSAQILSIPIIIYYFGKISVAGLISNIIAIPCAGVIVAIGIVTVSASFIVQWAAVYFAAANDILILAFNRLVAFIGSLDFSYITVRYFSLRDIAVFYAFLLFFLLVSGKFIHLKGRVVLFCLVTLNIFIFCSLDDRSFTPYRKLSIVMIDVGQGDAFLLKFPDGETALIDAGMATADFDNGERRIKPLLDYLKINSIDYAFISHVDSDHYAGFVSLIHLGLIKKIYKPFTDTANIKDIRFERFIRKSDLPVFYLRSEILKIGNARIYVLNSGIPGIDYKNTTNDKSGFMKIVYGRTSFLFTGDLEKSAELYYSAEYHDFLKSNVLKVSHHGSSGATGDIFLRLVKPEISLISAGLGNKFGHPAQATLDKLRRVRTTILRTDSSGAAILHSDGKNICIMDWHK